MEFKMKTLKNLGKKKRGQRENMAIKRPPVKTEWRTVVSLWGKKRKQIAIDMEAAEMMLQL